MSGMAIDKAAQLGDFDTITREEYHRINGNGTAPGTPGCLECGKELTEVQIKRGGKFCSHRCGGAYNARIPAKPKPEMQPTPEPPTEEPPPLEVHPDDHGLIHIAAALVDVLLAIPGTRSVEMWVGPIGPIEVRR